MPNISKARFFNTNQQKLMNKALLLGAPEDFRQVFVMAIWHQDVLFCVEKNHLSGLLFHTLQNYALLISIIDDSYSAIISPLN